MNAMETFDITLTSCDLEHNRLYKRFCHGHSAALVKMVSKGLGAKSQFGVVKCQCVSPVQIRWRPWFFFSSLFMMASEPRASG